MLSLAIKQRAYPLKKREFAAAKRGTLEATGFEWHREFYDDHFEVAATARYGYYRRKGELQRGTKFFKRSYTGRKERLFGHAKPLVFSGEAYRAFKVPQVRASQFEAKVLLSSKFNFRNPKSRINMRDEATRVLPDQVNRLVAFADADLDQRLKKITK